MPRGVYDRKRPEPCAETVAAIELETRPEVWRAFDTVRGHLANLKHAERRAVLGALQGWFNDGKYD